MPPCNKTARPRLSGALDDRSKPAGPAIRGLNCARSSAQTAQGATIPLQPHYSGSRACSKRIKSLAPNRIEPADESERDGAKSQFARRLFDG